jgi:GxxExxY protein
MELLHKEITEQIIGAAFEVYRELGYGFLEKVYQRAMQVELRLRGLKAEIEQKIQVVFKGTSSEIIRRTFLYQMRCSWN